MSYLTKYNRQLSLNDRALFDSYQSIFEQAYNNNEFDPILQENSRKLFFHYPEKGFIPKRVEVYAVVVGLSFSQKLQDQASQIQKELESICNSKNCYWVLPQNLASELIILKWPENQKITININEVKVFLETLIFEDLHLNIEGFQINIDGCVLLRGFDNGILRNIRTKLIKRFPNLPSKQSLWIHIPLGRILNPISSEKYREIMELALNSTKKSPILEKIPFFKLIKENQWYMTDKEQLWKVKANSNDYWKPL